MFSVTRIKTRKRKSIKPDQSQITIRPFHEKDRPVLEEICLAAGGRGGHYTQWLNVSPGLFLDIWLNYYLDREPDLAFVAEGNGTVLGYLISCRSVKKKNREMMRTYYPRVCWRILTRRYKFGLNAVTLALRVVCDWARFGLPKIDGDKYPAEVHVNVRQSQPQYHEIVGRLLATYYEKAARMGIKGVRGIMAVKRRNLNLPRHMGFVGLDVRPTTIFPKQERYLFSIGAHPASFIKQGDFKPAYSEKPLPIKRRGWYELLRRIFR